MREAIILILFAFSFYEGRSQNQDSGYVQLRINKSKVATAKKAKMYIDSLCISKEIADSMVFIQSSIRDSIIALFNHMNLPTTPMDQRIADQNKLNQLARQRIDKIKQLLTPEQLVVYRRLIMNPPREPLQNPLLTRLAHPDNKLKQEFMQHFGISNAKADTLMGFCKEYNARKDSLISHQATNMTLLHASMMENQRELNLNVARIFTSEQYDKWMHMEKNNFIN